MTDLEHIEKRPAIIIDERIAWLEKQIEEKVAVFDRTKQKAENLEYELHNAYMLVQNTSHELCNLRVELAYLKKLLQDNTTNSIG